MTLVGRTGRSRELSGVEDPPPVVIVVARSSDVKLASFDTHVSVSPAYPAHRKRAVFYRLLALLPLTRTTLNIESLAS